MVTKKGFVVFPTINVPPGTINVKISASGTVEAYLKNQIEPINLGTIPLFTFNNPPGLKSVGGNLYEITQTSGLQYNNWAERIMPEKFYKEHLSPRT